MLLRNTSYEESDNMKNDVDLQLDFNVKSVISPTEETLKFKTAEPIKCEPGEAIMYNWEGKDNG